jgi:hypothetical protein
MKSPVLPRFFFFLSVFFFHPPVRLSPSLRVPTSVKGAKTHNSLFVGPRSGLASPRPASPEKVGDCFVFDLPERESTPIARVPPPSHAALRLRGSLSSPEQSPERALLGTKRVFASSPSRYAVKSQAKVGEEAEVVPEPAVRLKGLVQGLVGLSSTLPITTRAPNPSPLPISGFESEEAMHQAWEQEAEKDRQRLLDLIDLQGSMTRDAGHKEKGPSRTANDLVRQASSPIPPVEQEGKISSGAKIAEITAARRLRMMQEARLANLARLTEDHKNLLKQAKGK